MKITHWAFDNGSGLSAVAASMARAEVARGHYSVVTDPLDPQEGGWIDALDSDVHVLHGGFPRTIGGKSFRKALTKPLALVYVMHSPPEYLFEHSVAEGVTNGYGAGMEWHRHQRLMQIADGLVTFCPRHQALYELATDKATIVDLIPMGMDLEFWRTSEGPQYIDPMVTVLEGEPRFLTCENQFPFKSAYDILRVWPWVRAELETATLHASNMPCDTEKWFWTLINRTGAIEGLFCGSWRYSKRELRGRFQNASFYVSPVRFGDSTRTNYEASAAGARVISYPGNEWADFWMHEGDHRRMARDLIAIGRGDVEPRPDKKPIPSEDDMAVAAIAVYERILDRVTAGVPGAALAPPDPVPAPEAAAHAVPEAIPAADVDAAAAALPGDPVGGAAAADGGAAGGDVAAPAPAPDVLEAAPAVPEATDAIPEVMP
jgi:hypothetical protein